ncbi:hypothetical protein EI94DRAFT_1707050 [Lactarius quietus]|nr:hypothetical protein EI94DRAFT_1707050 [Lactarius quietus]
MTSPSGFNSQGLSTPGPCPRPFGTPTSTGPSHSTQSQPMQATSQLFQLDPQLNMTPTTPSHSSSFSFPPPAQPPWQQRTESSFSLDSQADFPSTVEPEVPPSFIEALSQSMGFATDGDDEYRKGLHAFPKMNIRLVAGEMLLNPTCLMYMKMHINVEDRIHETQTELRFVNIFGNLSRQRLLATAIRRSCSSLRNAYQELMVEAA